MAHHENRYGLWITIRDEASALEAVKMSGLPVLLLGINAFFLAWLASFTYGIDHFVVWLWIMLGCILAFGAFRLRAGGWRLAPVLIAPTFFIFAGSFILAPNLAIVVQCFIIGLAFGGLRGWHWLRQNARQR